MAYGVGLSSARERPAGLIALGGRMPTGIQPDLKDPIPPIFIAHGTDDDSVPVEMARSARDRLGAAGARVVYRETPVGHTIDQAIIPELRSFLRQVGTN